ncbi:MAG: DUF4423 domain-containing protein [Proteobacteria bacterium]|nr:DUF4423 domain-containing protein [Pseudomonadota bacterium]
MVTIYNYNDYQGFLKAGLKKGFGDNRKRSQTDFADFLKCQPAYISMVLNDKAQLSMEQAYRTTEYFELSQKEAHFFMLLVQKSRSTNPGLVQYFEKQIENLKMERTDLSARFDDSKTISTEQSAQYYSAWYYAAIHMALTVPSMRTVPSLVQKFNLPKTTIDMVCDFLLRTGLAVEQNGQLGVGPVRLHTGKSSPFLNQSHAMWRMQAISCLQRPKDSDFHYSSVVSMSQSDLPVLREAMIAAIESIRSTVRDSKEEIVAVYAMDLFSLVREM